MIVDDMYYAKAQISKPQSLICYNLFYFIFLRFAHFHLGSFLKFVSLSYILVIQLNLLKI